MYFSALLLGNADFIHTAVCHFVEEVYQKEPYVIEHGVKVCIVIRTKWFLSIKGPIMVPLVR